MTAPVFKHLILGSGGMAGLAYIGLLRYLQERDLQRHIKHYYGVSIGAIFGFLFATGVGSDIIEAEIKASYCDIHQTRIPFDAIHSIHQTYGLNNGELATVPLKNIYRRFYNQQFPKQSYNIEQLTFIEFAKHTGSTLTIVATNVSTMQPVFFSVDTTPHQCVWTAIQASMTIPGIFQPVKINDDYYVDGFITCEFPVPPVLYTKLDPSATLGVFMTSCVKQTNPPQNFGDYFLRIMGALVFYSKETNQMIKTLNYVIQLTEMPVEMLPLKIHNDGIYLRLSLHDVDLSIAYGYTESYTFFHPLISQTTICEPSKPSTESYPTV